MDASRVRVGCCGFPIARAEYGKNFRVTEIQQTFFDPPPRDTLRVWRKQAPSDFEFVVRAWQLITHDATSPTYAKLRRHLTALDLKQAGGFRTTPIVLDAWKTMREILDILGADKVLFQTPETFYPGPDSRDRMRRFFATIERAGVLCLWDPRGMWPDEEIAEVCEDAELLHVVDPFERPSLTCGMQYWRILGFEGFRHRFEDAELRELCECIPPDEDTYTLFANASMLDDAIRMRNLVEPSIS